MKAKNILRMLSLCLSVTMIAFAVVGCTDFDNGFDEASIRFNEDFRAQFGDIDPEQDWNLAERSNVTVTTTKESEIKIYVLRGNEYCIAGDYTGIKGTQTLGFDMVEGTTNIMVSDGVTSVQTVPGGSANFSGTRTIHPSSDGVIITPIPAGGATIGTKTYKQYLEGTEADYDAMKAVVPEIGYRKNYTNLNRVTHDFTYVSTGKFIIYPYYWETSSDNTIGIYYFDAQGTRRDVDVYTIRSGSELQYMTNSTTSWVTLSQNFWDAVNQLNYVGSSEYNSNGYNSNNFKPAVWTGETNASVSSDVTTNYVDPSTNTLYWKYQLYYTGITWTGRYNNVIGGEGSNLFGFSTDDIKNNKKLIIDGINFGGTTTNFRVIFYKKGDTSRRHQIYLNKEAILNNGGRYEFNLDELDDDIRSNGTLCLAGALNDANPAGTFTEYGGNGSHQVLGEVTFSSIKLTGSTMSQPAQYKPTPTNGWKDYNNMYCSEIFTKYDGVKMRGRGIEIDIPEGTVFGMYLKKANPLKMFFSQSVYNGRDPLICGPGVIDDGLNQSGSVVEVDENPSFASTFTANGHMFMGFEDWPNNDANNRSDFDLNDVVLAFDGAIPIVQNEAPDPAGTWLLACEDLGGSFDVDYNDVVFKVEHISGQTTARVTPLAAGGTLASYIFFKDNTDQGNNDFKNLGEIHQLFGEAPAVSGEYSPINVYNNRADKTGKQVDIKVDKDWSMANFTVESYVNNYAYEGSVNMGGFEIRVLRSGAPVPQNDSIHNSDFSDRSRVQTIKGPEAGSAPYILCLPYTYTVENSPSEGMQTSYVWAWPVELCNISRPYPDFDNWVTDKNNRDWYKRGGTAGLTVPELKYVTPMMLSNGKRATSITLEVSSYTMQPGGTISIAAKSNRGGELKYTLSNKAAGTYYPAENKFVASAGFNGEVTLTVEQIENEYYAEGRAEVTIKIGTVKKEPEFVVEPQDVIGDSWKMYGSRSTDWSFEIETGHWAFINGVWNGYSGSGTFSIKSFDPGTTGANYILWDGRTTKNYMVENIDNPGTIKLVLHFSGDDQYYSKDVNITIKCVKKQTVRIKATNQTATNLYLSYDNSTLQLSTTKNDAADWTLEWVDSKSFRLYNGATKAYMVCNPNSSMAVSFIKTIPTNNRGLFTFGQFTDYDGKTYNNVIFCKEKENVRCFGRIKANGSYNVSANSGDKYSTPIEWSVVNK